MQFAVAVHVSFVMMAGVSKSATAAPFYVAADFSATNNPNGVWISASFDQVGSSGCLLTLWTRSAWCRQQSSLGWPNYHYAGQIKVWDFKRHRAFQNGWFFGTCHVRQRFGTSDAA